MWKWKQFLQKKQRFILALHCPKNVWKTADIAEDMRPSFYIQWQQKKHKQKFKPQRYLVNLKKLDLFYDNLFFK